MQSQPRVAKREHTLAQAGRLMAEVGCGVLPVVDDDHAIVGMLTDRDICCTAALLNKKPSKLKVGDSMAGEVFSCHADDSVQTALGIMRTHQVRRLPVVDSDKRLRGILSLDEVVHAAEDDDSPGVPGPTHRDISETLKAIAGHPVLAPQGG
jgi:CBS domain-containing protein